MKAAWSLALLAILAVTPGAAQQHPDRTQPPAIGPAPMVQLPPITKRMLSNGLSVWVVEQHKVPLVQVDLVVNAGADDDPPGRFGVASLTAAMLDEGAGMRTALQISDAVDFLGAELGATSGYDASAVRLNVPVARLAEALPIMADVALRPTFPSEELERVRQERVTALLQARDDPEALVPRALARAVFGPIHRYGTGLAGGMRAIKAFTLDDLRSFHATFYQPTNATLVVVGDVTADAVLPLLDKAFGAWKQTAPVTRTPVPPAKQLSQRTVYLVDVPNAAQSQIRIGWVGVPRSTSDYFPLEVLNTILGGSFTSRLNQNLREQHGYTYGAGSAFDMRLTAGPFLAAAGVQTDKTADALREFFNELTNISKPISGDEVMRAKNYIALGLPSEFETIGDLASHVEELVTYKLPDDYFERYVPNIEAVTAEQVQKAAEMYIQPEHFAVVVVGDRSKIEPGIRALKLGPIRVMPVDEVIGVQGVP
jgi:zinc protease